jgi:hypothetical protein
MIRQGLAIFTAAEIAEQKTAGRPAKAVSTGQTYVIGRID